MDAAAGRSRPDPVAVALANLTDPRKSGTLFVGPVGSGKTYVLQAVLDQVRRSTKMSRRVVATNLAVHPLADIRALLRSAADPTAGTPHIVAADNLDRCGPQALQLIADALDQGHIQLVGTVRADAAAKLMSRLRPARTPTVLELVPWSARDLGQHAQDVLGGALSTWSADLLRDFAGGNPLCLSELVEQGRVAGRLRRRFDEWVWVGSLAPPPATLARVGESLRPLGAPTLAVVATLGVTGPVPLARLLQLCDVAEVERAEAADVVAADLQPDGEFVVRLVRPLDGQVALATTSLIGLRALCARLVAALVATGPDDDGPAGLLTGVARLCRRTGTAVPAALRTRTARAALARHEPELVAWLLRDEPLSDAEAALRVEGLVEAQRFVEAADLLVGGDSVPVAAVDDDACGRAAALLSLAGRPGGAGRQPPESSHTAYADVWAGRDLLRHQRRRPPASTERVEDQRRLLTAMAASLQLGLVEETLRLSRRPGAAAVARFAPPLRVAWWSVVGFAHLCRGAVREADAVAEALSRLGLTDRWPLAYAAGCLLAGRCALVRGEPTRAAHFLVESLAAAGYGPVALDQGLALESLAAAFAMAGRDADSRTADQDSVGEPGRPVPRLLDALTRLTRAELLFGQGHRAAALAAVDEVATTARATDQHLVALLAGHLLARLAPSARHTERVEAAAAACDFPLATVLVRHSSALEHGHGQVLAQVSDVYADSGLAWLAAESAAAALGGASTSSFASWTGAARRRVAALQRDPGLVAPAWWGVEDPDRTAVVLTFREQEVAEAVVGGETSAEIGARLHLSRRTVENHLQHVYRKLGISSRLELADALPPRNRPTRFLVSAGASGRVTASRS